MRPPRRSGKSKPKAKALSADALWMRVGVIATVGFGAFMVFAWFFPKPQDVLTAFAPPPIRIAVNDTESVATATVTQQTAILATAAHATATRSNANTAPPTVE